MSFEARSGPINRGSRSFRAKSPGFFAVVRHWQVQAAEASTRCSQTAWRSIDPLYARPQACERIAGARPQCIRDLCTRRSVDERSAITRGCRPTLLLRRECDVEIAFLEMLDSDYLRRVASVHRSELDGAISSCLMVRYLCGAIGSSS